MKMYIIKNTTVTTAMTPTLKINSIMFFAIARPNKVKIMKKSNNKNNIFTTPFIDKKMLLILLLSQPVILLMPFHSHSALI